MCADGIHNIDDPAQLKAKLLEMAHVINQQNDKINFLQGRHGALQEERDRLQVAFDEADAERRRLQCALDRLIRAQYGRKSERLDPDQFQLTLENLEQDIAVGAARQEAEAADPAAAEGKIPKPPRRPANRALGHLPEHLERYEVRIEPEDTTCPCCGGALHEIAVEKFERADYVPARIRVRVTVHPKYGCRSCGDAVVQAPAPDSLVPGGLPTEALIASIAVAKYLDGLPLYRQAQIFARDGLILDRQTLADWMGRAAWLLTPLWQLLLTTVMSSPRLFVDDTRLPVLDPGRKQTRTGALWGIARDDAPWGGDLPPTVAYVYTEDRTYVRARELLAGYTGVLQVDGWGGFKRLTGRTDAGKATATAPTLAFCWAHGRRAFVDLHEKAQSPIAEEVLRHIAALYRIEDAIRGQPPDARQTVRQARSKPLVDDLRTYLEQQLARVSGKMPVAKAMRYLLTHWDGLCVFLNDGRVDLDSNTIERLHRVVATCRKNSLFAGSDAGARTWAIFTSLIQTARLNGINPLAWLTDVLERLVSGDVKINALHRLLPWEWKAEQAARAAGSAAA